MKTPMAYVHNENHAEKKIAYFRRFWVKESRHSENISDEKCYLYRSMRPHCNALITINRTTVDRI